MDVCYTRRGSSVNCVEAGGEECGGCGQQRGCSEAVGVDSSGKVKAALGTVWTVVQAVWIEVDRRVERVQTEVDRVDNWTTEWAVTSRCISLGARRW